MAMDREISRIRIGNQNKHAGKSGKNQRLNPNEKYINKISRIQVHNNAVNVLWIDLHAGSHTRQEMFDFHNRIKNVQNLY